MSWNPDDKSSNIILSNGDCSISLTETLGSGGVRSLYGLSSGKWYVEFRFDFLTASSQWFGFGNTSFSLSSYLGADTNSWGLQVITLAYGSGKCRAHHNGSYIEYGDRGSTLVRLALDLDNKKAWYSTSAVSWEGDPTDPIDGNPAHSFVGNTDTLYLAFYGTRTGSGAPSGTAYFDDTDLWGEIPTGYLPIADGYPKHITVSSSTLTLTGQAITQTGGFLPVNLIISSSTLTQTGQITTSEGFVFADGLVHLEHHLAGPTCRLQVRHDFVARTPPVVYARSTTAQSALINRLLTGGKWLLGWRNTNWNDSNTYVYDNILCGLVRPDVDLNGSLGSGDEWMLSYGAWDRWPRFYHESSETPVDIGYSDYSVDFTFAFDFTDLTNGKVYLTKTPWTGSETPVLEGIVGPWYAAITVSGDFEVKLLAGESLSGYTSLIGAAQQTPTKLYGITSVETSHEATLIHTRVGLEFLVGNHLLRSATWNKHSQGYYLGLLTSMDPVTEPTASITGYMRQAVPIYNEFWNSDFSNVQRFVFNPFSATIVGWALFWRCSVTSGLAWHHDPVVWKQEFPSPIVCTVSQPGPSFPPNSFTWSFD